MSATLGPGFIVRSDTVDVVKLQWLGGARFHGQQKSVLGGGLDGVRINGRDHVLS